MLTEGEESEQMKREGAREGHHPSPPGTNRDQPSTLQDRPSVSTLQYYLPLVCPHTDSAGSTVEKLGERAFVHRTKRDG